MMVERGLIALAALLGALGVVLLAAGAHASGGLATTAGQMLVMHAPALMAGALALEAGKLHSGLGRVALVVLAIGTLLFAGDLAIRSLGHARLFPMAAPTGGSGMILGWVLLAVSAVLPRRPE